MIGRDDLIQVVPKLHRSQPDLTLERLIVEEEPRLGAILLKLPSAKERRFLHGLPAALGDRWVARALQLMQGNNARLVAAIPKVFSEAGKKRNSVPLWIAACANIPRRARCFSGFAKIARPGPN